MCIYIYIYTHTFIFNDKLADQCSISYISTKHFDMKSLVRLATQLIYGWHLTTFKRSMVMFFNYPKLV